MGTLELKNKLVKIINSSDERFLRMVNALYHSYQEKDTEENEVIAYTIKGEALTKASIIKNNKEALLSIQKGEYKTHEEIREKYA